MPNPPNISDLKRQQRISLNTRTSFKSVLTQGANTSQDNQALPPVTPSGTFIVSLTPTVTPTTSITPTITLTPSTTVTVTPTVTQTPTISITPTINYENIAKEKVVVFYNINSAESLEVANYYTENRPVFSQVNKVGLNITSPVYPQRRNSSGTVIISESGADINVPYEGCRKYDLIHEINYKTNIRDVVLSYINNNPSTDYIVFSIDTPLLITNNTSTGVPYLTGLVSGLSGLPYTLKLDIGRTRGSATTQGIFPFYLNAQYKEDVIAYINKLSRAQSDGIYLYNNRLCAYAEDSNAYGSNFYNLTDSSYNDVKDFYLFRSGRSTQTLNRPNTGMFCDLSSKWPHDTGNLSGGEICYFGTWGFNGRRYIYPNGPYQYNINGEEVAGLSGLSYFMDSKSSGKLTFNNPEKKDGWYFVFTFESFNGAMGGGSYGPYSGLVPNWGYFPSSYTGVKTFSAFMNSSEYNAGLRPIKHSHYCQYFSPSAFGGTHYENTPITWIGHLYEPIWGVLSVGHIDSWLRGNTAYTVVSNNLASGSNQSAILCIGDPLVYVKTPVYNIPVTPSPTPTPTLAPLYNLPVYCCMQTDNPFLSSASGTFIYSEGGGSFIIYTNIENSFYRLIYDDGAGGWAFYGGSYAVAGCFDEVQYINQIPTSNYVDTLNQDPVVFQRFSFNRCSDPAPTPTITPTISITPSITPTITPTISITSTLTQTPTITLTNSVTPSITPTLSITPTISITPSITRTQTPTPTVTPSNPVPPFNLPTHLCLTSNANILSSWSGTYSFSEGDQDYISYLKIGETNLRYMFQEGTWCFYNGPYAYVCCWDEIQSISQPASSNFVDIFYNPYEPQPGVLILSACI